LQDQHCREELPRVSIREIINSKDIGIYYFNTEQQKFEEEIGDRQRTTEVGKHDMNVILEIKISKVVLKDKEYRLLELKDVSQIVYS
jgi:hypothetical protein